ncbi:hypothetical protein, partial [Klebsiella pneumoniae]|uniref:hypothetical protein n=1 Tax=Klebsiella pneumoniae TaxID=573 RepID=UPI001BE044AA
WKSLFTSTAKNSSSLKFFEPSRLNGDVIVSPPSEVVLEGVEQWKDCLVGQFIDRRIPFPVVCATVDKLWWGKKEMP